MLFEDLLTKTEPPDQQQALYRGLFNLRLHLALTDVRGTFHYLGQAFSPTAIPVPLVRRWQWSLDFVKELVHRLTCAG